MAGRMMMRMGGDEAWREGGERAARSTMHDSMTDRMGRNDGWRGSSKKHEGTMERARKREMDADDGGDEE